MVMMLGMSMTVEELSKLPEVPMFRTRILPNGHTVSERYVPRLAGCQLKPDDPLMFTDEEGSWSVIYHFEGGPYKERIRF